MKNVTVVIGANFGDEGKGLMTDYFCNSYPNRPVLNVRFNGGAQAGHTVVTPMGRRHVFGHFGAGSFNPNVATYLSSRFIVNPILFRREYEKLESLGVKPLVYMHPRCLLTIPQDMMINQMVERHRGSDRHGSCGVGIFETIYRSRVDNGITVDGALNSNVISRLTDRDYSEWHLTELGVSKVDTHDKFLLSNQNISARYIQDVQFLKSHVIVTDEEILQRFDNVVFEGAQGLQLDQNNTDYFPHLTPSNTGLQNVVEMFKWCDLTALHMEVCYVSRPYFTRHGAGMLKTECDRHSVDAMVDETNHHNEFQGGFRYGYFDDSEFTSAVMKDMQKIPSTICDYSIAFTHADETKDSIMFSTGKLPIEQWNGASLLGIETKYLSHGATRCHVTPI